MRRIWVSFIVFTAVLLSLSVANATDFQITRNAGDATNALLIEKSDGTDQFWVDKDGYVYANGSLLTGTKVNTLTCGGTDKFSAWDNSTGLFTCSADDSAGAPADIHLIGNVTSVGCAVNEILKVNATGFFSCAADNDSGAPADIHLIGNVTSTGCASNEILKVSGASWICSTDLQGSGGGSGGATHQPYDYFIYTNSSGYYAFNNTNSLISNNADFDTVWTALQADDVYTNNDQVIIELGSGQFLTDTGITINRDNVTLAGQNSATWLALDTGTAEGTELITLGSIISSTTYNITDAATGDLVITTDVAADAGNFATGDYIVLQNDRVIDNTADEKQAQHAQVRNAYGGNGTIQLLGSLWEDFDTVNATSPTVRLSNTLIENIIIKDLSLTDLRTSVTSAHRGYISVNFVKDIHIDNVKVEDVYYVGISVRGSMDIRISDCNVLNVQKVVNNNIIHYGIGLNGLNYNYVISGCNFEHTRHSVYSNAGSRAEGFSGQNRNVIIDGNTSTGVSANCWDTHGGGSVVTISNNSCEGRSSNITNDPATAESGGISARTSSVIIGNTITNIETRCIHLYQESEVDNTALKPDKSIISGNRCINIGNDGIRVANATNVIISDNLIEGVTNDCIEIDNGVGTYDMFVKVSNNIVKDCGTDGIETTGARIEAIGNTIDTTGGMGIYVNGAAAYTFDASGSVFKDNNIILAGDHGMRFNRANAVTVDGNIIDRPANNCLMAITNADYDLSNSTVTNNICISPDYPNIGGNPSRFIYGEDIIGSYFANNRAINATTNNLAIYAFPVDSADNFFIDNTITGDFGDGLDMTVTGGGSNYCLGNYYTENGGSFFDNNDGTCPT